jgi:hypothetical protein
VKHARIAALLLSSALLAACGVRFSEADPGTEFFKSIDISGQMRAGDPLTVVVGYDQYYPVEVAFQCELRRNKQLVTVIGEATVPPLEGGGPDATPFPGVFSFDFSAAEPGTYVVECLTPIDEDNFIGDEITIAPAADQTPGGPATPAAPATEAP